MRDKDVMEDPRDSKPPKDKKIFTCIAAGIVGNIAPLMRPMGIGKRPRKSSKASNEAAELAERV